MFIKLNSLSDGEIWVNVTRIETIINENEFSSVFFAGDEGALEVEESPEKIVDLIKEMKKCL